MTLVFSTKGQRYLRVGLAVPLFGSLACLRRMVADEGKISPDQVSMHTHYSLLSLCFYWVILSLTFETWYNSTEHPVICSTLKRTGCSSR